MAKLAAAPAALETYCGFPAARTRQVDRRLLEEGLLEPGAPFVSVEINEADFTLLLLAVASGAPIPRVGDVTVLLAGAVPNGIDVAVMPDNIRPAKMTAFDVLHGQIWSAARHSDAIVSDLEVVETWPEVVFHLPEGAARFHPAGSLANHWQGSKQRRSTRIPGSAIAHTAKNLFGGK
ncbi:hypothetical protein [Mesorhizobium sp.]|uniref:hypothetical protein n=1 Tax=Mesorhizobium sp. TaxID=1871066 RepID=UPI000FE2B46E|nr:hypothetical protein [Mesorhizobium sp.]RWN99373.1 MAG: hypothetical protein EOS06_18455 [Mesorhizobium sp.]